MNLQGQSTLSDAEKFTEAKRHVAILQDAFEQLAPNEQRFVSDLAERIERYGPKTLISNKQLFWLRDISTAVLDR